MADLHGWQSDPFDLHEQRYFSQGKPTKLVRDGGIEAYDPPPDASPALAPNLFGHANGGAQLSVPMMVVVSEPALIPDSPTHSAQVPGPGWWLASDGNWYPPETHPNAAPAGPDWWLASDGNWYPPETHPDAERSESIAGS